MYRQSCKGVPFEVFWLPSAILREFSTGRVPSSHDTVSVVESMAVGNSDPLSISEMFTSFKISTTEAVISISHDSSH